MLVLRIVSLLAIVATPVFSQTCQLCPNGNKNPYLPSDPQLNSVCKQLIVDVQKLGTGPCNGFHAGPYPTVCGCVTPYNFPCKVCPNGGTPNPFGQENINTCNQIRFTAALSTTTAACTANLKTYKDRQINITKVCGCPGVPKPCSVCPDGSTVAAPSKPIGLTNTCGTQDAYLKQSIPANSPACAIVRASGLAYTCGCSWKDAKPCSICNGGATRTSNRVTGLTDYCRNFDNQAIFRATNNCFNNTNLYNQWACGCPNAVPPCKLCSDGGTPNYSKVSNFSRIGGNCGLDQLFLQNINRLDCKAIQGTVGKVCGCTNSNLPGTCKLCTNRDLPNPNKMVPSFGHSCGFIEYFATAQSNAGSKTCTFYRGEYVDTCCNGGPDPYPPRSI